MATVEVSPSVLPPGESVAVTSRLSNDTDEAQMVTVSVRLRGPCGISASKGYVLLLKSHQSDTSNSHFAAPACPGDYQALLTASDRDGKTIATSTARFRVQLSDPQIADTTK